MPDELHIEPLAHGEVPALAALLADSFRDDAAYRYLLRAEADPTPGLARFFERNLRTHLPYRCTYVARDRSGALLATVTARPPGGVPISAATMVRRGVIPFMFAHGPSAVKRLVWLKDTYDALEQRAAGHAVHWHVHMMAVRRDAQGRGIGSAVLRDVLERSEQAGTHPIVLTTHLPENVAFYRRARFEVTAEQALAPPGARPYTVWSMRRDP